MYHKSALLVIGLPAAGKSSIARELSKRLGLGVFDSDNFFRECRALPEGSDDPRRDIMSRFIERVEGGNVVNVGELDPRVVREIRKDASSLDEQGRCPFADGVYFRRHGENVFRTYEIEMLKWAHENGVLDEKIPDLSGSAPRFEENRRLFSRENGYLPILVDPPSEVVARNLIQDYETVLAKRDGRNDEFTIRGNYEKMIDDALAQVSPAKEEEREQKLSEIAMTLVERGRTERMSAYREHAVHTLEPK